MVNSHYIPQFILRNFCSNNKIQYYNKKTHLTETRSTKSVFSEKGYYPEQLEKDLCHKIEYQFSVVLNSKILNAKNSITLNADDLWIVKKYLIITMLRVHDDNMETNVLFRFLLRDGFIDNPDEFKEMFSRDFFDNISRILDCPNPQTALNMAFEDYNMPYLSVIKDVMYSYNVFVKTNKTKEEFVMPDRGWANYCGIISVKKLNAIMNMPIFSFDPFAQQILKMSSPQDYAIFPLSKNLALIAVSPIIQIMLPNSQYKMIFPPEAPTLSKCMGFGNNKLFAPPNKQLIARTKLYNYEIHQLKLSDVIFLNSLLIENSKSYIGFSDYDKIKYSFENNSIIVK